jgi:hypothetical protein
MMTSPGQIDGIMLAPVTLRRTSPKLWATSATSSQANSDRCFGSIAMVRQSGILRVKLALSLGTGLAARKRTSFEDALEAKLRFVIGLFPGLAYQL